MKKLALREVQIALLDVLSEFDRICKEHNLRYTIAAGTLLGAVRHKGFIPWDDDMDVYMPRPDYEKFVQLIQKEGVLPAHLTYSPDRGRGTNYCFTKILDTRYPLRSPNHVEVKYLFLDVFPVDGAADTAEERKKQFKKEHTWVVRSGICQWYTMDRWWGFIAYIIGFWFYIGANIVTPRSRCVRKMNELAQKYEYGTTKMATCHNYGYPDEAVPTEVYESYSEIEFEGKKFMAVTDYETLLKNTFGDYMQLPPVKKRRSRHYIKIYKK